MGGQIVRPKDVAGRMKSKSKKLLTKFSAYHDFFQTRQIDDKYSNPRKFPMNFPEIVLSEE